MIIFKPLGLIAEFINFNFLFAKISRALYFIQTKRKSNVNKDNSLSLKINKDENVSKF